MARAIDHIENGVATSEELVHPASREYRAYWDTRRGDRAAPRRADIEPLLDLPHLVQFIALVRVETEDRFFFSVVGTGIRDEIGVELTGRHLDGVDLNGFETELATFYRAVRDSLKPLYFVGRYGPAEISKTAYEASLFPIASDDLCTHVMIGMAYWSS